MTPEPARAAARSPDKPSLTFTQVGFHYGTAERPVFTNFSLHIPAGSHVLVTGESGAGKSSLINLLLRFAEFQKGQIRIGEVDLRDLAHETVRATFGVMTQQTHLFNTTIQENIRLGRKNASDKDVVAAAKKVQIHAFNRGLPAGYDTLVGEGGVRLSGGERQRIALARMLLKEPPIWLLDEITANLDPITAGKVLQAVVQAAGAHGGDDDPPHGMGTPAPVRSDRGAFARTRTGRELMGGGD